MFCWYPHLPLLRADDQNGRWPGRSWGRPPLGVSSDCNCRTKHKNSHPSSTCIYAPGACVHGGINNSQCLRQGNVSPPPFFTWRKLNYGPIHHNFTRSGSGFQTHQFTPCPDRPKSARLCVCMYHAPLTMFGVAARTVAYTCVYLRPRDVCRYMEHVGTFLFPFLFARRASDPWVSSFTSSCRIRGDGLTPGNNLLGMYLYRSLYVVSIYVGVCHLAHDASTCHDASRGTGSIRHLWVQSSGEDGAKCIRGSSTVRRKKWKVSLRFAKKGAPWQVLH